MGGPGPRHWAVFSGVLGLERPSERTVLYFTRGAAPS
jgi:hypothetical protein